MATAEENTEIAASPIDPAGSVVAQFSTAPGPARPHSLVLLHWATVACLLIAATLILARETVDGKTLRLWLIEGHRHFGLIVLLLFFVRIALRLRLGKLPATAELPPMMRIAAATTHVALYLLLLVLPVMGWALSNAKGWPVYFFGVTLPDIAPSDEDLADKLTMFHQGAAWLLLVLALMHAGAALWHHLVRKDDVLRAMLPKFHRSRIRS